MPACVRQVPSAHLYGFPGVQPGAGQAAAESAHEPSGHWKGTAGPHDAAHVDGLVAQNPSGQRYGVAAGHPAAGHDVGVIAQVPSPHWNGIPIGQLQEPAAGRQPRPGPQVISPAAHVPVPHVFGHVPPQSIPVSVPFLIPSTHVGNGGEVQTPATQLPIAPHELPQVPQLNVSTCRLFVRIGASCVTCPAVTATGFTLMKNPGGMSS
jgi:hypothetical protein